MEALLAILLTWLEVHTDLNTDIPYPEVIELSPNALTKEYYTDYPAAIPVSGVDNRVQALYAWGDGPSGTIYILASHFTELSPNYDAGLKNPLFQERLLHELVHHVQYHNGKYEQFKCQNQGELLAYSLGGTFLRQHNIIDPLPNRRVLAHMYSRC